MLENNFASIGKGVLIHGIGMQDNHKISHELDRKLSGCFSCSHLRHSLKDPTCSKCSSCPTRKFKDDAYINEKHRYGYQPSLSLCAIKLFTYLHFSVTGCGVVEELSVTATAKRLQMSARSVHNCLHSLKENGYIEYTRNKPGSYLVLVTDYENYFKTAKEGGRGYLVFSRDFFEKAILAAKGINELRFHIRMYLNVDDKKHFPVQPQTFLTDSKSISDVCRYFPHYVKPVHIRRLIEKVSSVFEIRQTDNTLIYSLNQDFYGELQKNTIKGDCAAKLEETFQLLNTSLKNVFEGCASLVTIPAFLSRQVAEAKVNHDIFYLEPTKDDLDDCTQICVQYGYHTMIKALHYILSTSTNLTSLSSHYGEYIRYAIEHRLCVA